MAILKKVWQRNELQGIHPGLKEREKEKPVLNNEKTRGPILRSREEP